MLLVPYIASVLLIWVPTASGWRPSRQGIQTLPELTTPLQQRSICRTKYWKYCTFSNYIVNFPFYTIGTKSYSSTDSIWAPAICQVKANDKTVSVTVNCPWPQGTRSRRVNNKLHLAEAKWGRRVARVRLERQAGLQPSAAAWVGAGPLEGLSRVLSMDAHNPIFSLFFHFNVFKNFNLK